MTPRQTSIPDPYRLPELLAPAGGCDALVAAVNNGADAVYLGLRELNARRGAENFDIEGVAAACRYAHLRGVGVYLTANVLIAASEMDDAMRMVAEAWAAGVDAVIVQDLGLMDVLRQTLPHVRVHASTQVDAHNVASVRALADLGAARVTLARETSLSEIASFVADGAAEIESFVHGSLCFCYSGQCLLSSLIGGRSANRGLCAQPCRLAYSLVGPDGAERRVPGAYLLSPKDLAGLDLLPDLIRAGVAALKMEGRMKAAEYVALVTGVYRSALDRAAADPEAYQATQAEWSVLSEAFSRGFSPAYVAGVRDDGMMSYKRPNNRGVLVGRVVEASATTAVVALEKALEAGDTLEFWTSRGRFAQRAGTMTVCEREAATAPAGERAGLRTERRASVGDRVFRVANAALLEAARRTWTDGAAGGLVPVDLAVRVRVGQPLSVTASARGASATADGPVVEPARTKPLTAAEVMEHVGRLGGSGFAAAAWELDLDPAAGAGFSTLHAVRRSALEALEERLLAGWADREAPSAVSPPSPTGRRASRGCPELVVSGWHLPTLEACLQNGADRALLAGTSAHSNVELPDRVAPLLPRVAHDHEVAALLELARRSGVATAGNLGLLVECVSAGVEVEADWPLNAFNPWTAALLAEKGARLVWASPELSGRQLAALAATSPAPIGALAYGRTELMVAEHCVLQAAGGCSQQCASCARRDSWWGLRDAKGYEFPVTSDAAGRSHIVNSVPLDLSRALDELVGSGVAAVRLEFTVESAKEAARVTRGFREALDAVVAGGPPPSGSLVEPATSGHFFRGVR